MLPFKSIGKEALNEIKPGAINLSVNLNNSNSFRNVADISDLKCRTNALHLNFPNSQDRNDFTFCFDVVNSKENNENKFLFGIENICGSFIPNSTLSTDLINRSILVTFPYSFQSTLKGLPYKLNGKFSLDFQSEKVDLSSNDIETDEIQNVNERTQHLLAFDIFSFDFSHSFEFLDFMGMKLSINGKSNQKLQNHVFDTQLSGHLHSLQFNFDSDSHVSKNTFSYSFPQQNVLVSLSITFLNDQNSSFDSFLTSLSCNKSKNFQFGFSLQKSFIQKVGTTFSHRFSFNNFDLKNDTEFKTILDEIGTFNVAADFNLHQLKPTLVIDGSSGLVWRLPQRLGEKTEIQVLTKFEPKSNDNTGLFHAPIMIPQLEWSSSLRFSAFINPKTNVSILTKLTERKPTIGFNIEFNE